MSKEMSIKIIVNRPGVEKQTIEQFYDDVTVLATDWNDMLTIANREVNDPKYREA